MEEIRNNNDIEPEMALCRLVDEGIKNTLLMQQDMAEDIGIRNLCALAKKVTGKFEKELNEIKAEGEKILDELYLTEDDLKVTFKKDVMIPMQNLFGEHYREGKYSMGKPYLLYLKKRLIELEDDIRGRLDW